MGRSALPLSFIFSLIRFIFPFPTRYHETAVRVYTSSRPRIISNGRYYWSYDWSRDRCFLEFKLIRVRAYVSFVLCFSRIGDKVAFRILLLLRNTFFSFKSLHMNAQWKFLEEWLFSGSTRYFGYSELYFRRWPLLTVDYLQRVDKLGGGMSTILAGWLIRGLVISRIVIVSRTKARK